MSVRWSLVAHRRGCGIGLRWRHVGLRSEHVCQQRRIGLGEYPQKLVRRAPAGRRAACTALVRRDPALFSQATGLARARHCGCDPYVGERRSHRSNAGKTAAILALKPLTRGIVHAAGSCCRGLVPMGQVRFPEKVFHRSPVHNHARYRGGVGSEMTRNPGPFTLSTQSSKTYDMRKIKSGRW